MPKTPNDILWQATHTGKYPKGVTAKQLANRSHAKGGLSLLHHAAWTGNYPPGTTAEDLLSPLDQDGACPLLYAVENGGFPPGLTEHLLKTTRDNAGQSAWDGMAKHYRTDTRDYIEKLHPSVFYNDVDLAIKIAEWLSLEEPTLKARATIWLSKVLAAQSQKQSKNER